MSRYILILQVKRKMLHDYKFEAYIMNLIMKEAGMNYKTFSGVYYLCLVDSNVKSKQRRSNEIDSSRKLNDAVDYSMK